MLADCGAGSLEDLFSHLPSEVRLRRPLDIAPGKSEYDIVDYFRARGEETAADYASFLGAGVYRHYRPVVVDAVVSRGEFLTSYTPYQAEIAQGTLTTIFEFQTMVCQLTGMEAANASVYDGSTAVPEAAMMAARITGRDRILVSRAVHPEYRQVLETSVRHQGLPVKEFGYDRDSGRIDLEDLERQLDQKTAAVIIQSPNFFGIVEDVRQAAEFAHRAGALLIFNFTEAVSLGLLEPPRDADIVCGELQSFAIPPSYGGPFAGIVATKEKFLRQIPGRIVGETKDTNGNRAYCLTLSTREQHIRREKATSNICTNQALDRSDGDRFYDALWQERPARVGGAELGQGALPFLAIAAAVLRAVLQRIRRGGQWARAGTDQRRLARAQDRRRPAAGAVLSRIGGHDAVLRHGNVPARADGRRCACLRRRGGFRLNDPQGPPAHRAERAAVV